MESNHVVLCLTEGMRQSKIKLTNSHRLATRDQGSCKNSMAFFKWLREALIKHTNVDLDSPARELLLKDWFITQPAPDIRRKFQKLALGPSTQLRGLLKIATAVFYNRNEEEEKIREGEQEGE